jgi:hypothetical protein
MSRLAGVGDAAGGHLQGREQRGGAVAQVVMGAPLDPARRHRPDRLGALQRLDLGLLVHTPHDGVRRWVQVQPDHVADLGLQLRIGGELERLGLPWLEVVLGPDPGDRAVADTQLAGQQPRGPVGTARCSGGGVSVAARISARRLRRTLWGRPRRGRSASRPALGEQPTSRGGWPSPRVLSEGQRRTAACRDALPPPPDRQINSDTIHEPCLRLRYARPSA